MCIEGHSLRAIFRDKDVGDYKAKSRCRRCFSSGTTSSRYRANDLAWSCRSCLESPILPGVVSLEAADLAWSRRPLLSPPRRSLFLWALVAMFVIVVG
ncbi:hypothetical protein SO802_005430 [Lithocarpus litseifolius]|uniref:Uncharacterized protein n=1 Tax=Lithocarpus litseifolius TaxID=425828 RepID=A0AAW2DKP5_9ROSI